MDDLRVDNYEKYQFLHSIGQGGMGTVYLAFDRVLERTVAIKKMRTDLFCGDDSRLHREAKLLARLNHPNIVQVYDFVKNPHEYAIVMEYIDGYTLTDPITSGAISHKQKLLWLIGIAQALGCAHDAGIIHRDLKSNNILITKNNEVKLTDFGIAKNVLDIDHSLTVNGSFNALSPEQATGKTITCRSDLFSFGLIMYQLYSGVHPLGVVHSPADYLNRLISGRFDNLRERVPNLSPRLTQLTHGLLDPEPGNRPMHAAECVAILQVELEQCGELHADPSQTVKLSSLQKGSKPLNNATEKGHSGNEINRSKPMLALFTTFLVVLVVIGYFKMPLRSPVVVGVLPVIVESESVGDPVQAQRYKHLIQHAVESTLVASPQYALISTSEMTGDSKAESVPEIGARTQADMLVQLELNCEAQSCEVTASILAGEKWLVTASESWPLNLQASTPVRAFDVAQTALARLFSIAPRNSLEKSVVVSNEGFLKYLELVDKHERFPAKADEYLADAHSLVHENPRYEPALDLYSDLVSKTYATTNDLTVVAEFQRSVDNIILINGQTRSTLAASFNASLLQGNFDQASQLLVQLRTISFDEEYLAKLNAKLCEKQGDMACALDAYLYSYKLRPSLWTQKQIAIMSLRLGQFELAKQWLMAIKDRYADDYYANNLLGSIALIEGNAEQAIVYYQAIDSQQYNSQDIQNLGVAFLLVGNYEEAVNLFSEGARRAPEHPGSLLNLADAHGLLDHTERATQLYRQAIELALKQEGSNPEVTMVLLQAYGHLGQNQALISLTQRAITAQTSDPNLLYAAALAFATIDEVSTSISFINRAYRAGVGIIWFRLSWFDRICKHTNATELSAELYRSLCG